MGVAGDEGMTIRVLQRIGSPAGVEPALSTNALSEEFQWAWENRIGLLYLLALPEAKLSPDLADRRTTLLAREAKTKVVMQRVCTHLNRTSVPYVIFKTLRPFPFTPNDIDVLFLGTDEEYESAVDLLMGKGYGTLGVAPLQTLAYDPAGEGKVGPKKQGGIYYLDLYRHAGADYIRYLDPRRASTQVRYLQSDGVSIPALKPALELAVMLFHNVFPENTYHIEHFYLILHYLYGENAIALSTFVRQVRENHFVAAVRANLTITAMLHEQAFGFVPDRLEQVLIELGGRDEKTLKGFRLAQYNTPYYFRAPLFLHAVLAKLAEWNSIQGFLIQTIHMLNPGFMLSTVRALTTRLKGVGVYEQV